MPMSASMTRPALREDAAEGKALTLLLNAAEERLQLVLARGDEMLCAQDWAARSRGTEILAPALERCFALLRLPFAELGRIACVRGPGSFTGIRLVLATSAALARVSGALQAGIDYMQLTAQGALASVSGGLARSAPRIHVLTHARHDQAHARIFTADQADMPVRPVSELELLGPESCLERLRADLSQGLDVAIAGSAFRRNELFRERLDAVFADLPGRLLRVPCRAPAPQDMLLLARHAAYGVEDIEPLYLRPCDAVENLAVCAERRGDDPAAARRRLEDLLNAPPAPDGADSP